jgi:hypothetical protein
MNEVFDGEGVVEDDPNSVNDCDLFFKQTHTFSENVFYIDARLRRVQIDALVLPSCMCKKPVVYVARYPSNYICFVECYAAASAAIAELARWSNTARGLPEEHLRAKRAVPVTCVEYKSAHSQDREAMANCIGVPGVTINPHVFVARGVLRRDNIAQFSTLGSGRRKVRVPLPAEPEAIVTIQRYVRGRGYERHYTPAVYREGFSVHDMSKRRTVELLASKIYDAYTFPLVKVVEKYTHTVVAPPMMHSRQQKFEMDEWKTEFLQHLKIGMAMHAMGNFTISPRDDCANSDAALFAIMHGGVRDFSIAPPNELCLMLMRALSVVDGCRNAGHRGFKTALPFYTIGYGMLNTSKQYAKAPGILEIDQHTLIDMAKTAVLQGMYTGGIGIGSSPNEIFTKVYYSLPPSKCLPFPVYEEKWNVRPGVVIDPCFSVGGARYAKEEQPKEILITEEIAQHCYQP